MAVLREDDPSTTVAIGDEVLDDHGVAFTVLIGLDIRDDAEDATIGRCHDRWGGAPRCVGGNIPARVPHVIQVAIELHGLGDVTRAVIRHREPEVLPVLGLSVGAGQANKGDDGSKTEAT